MQDSKAKTTSNKTVQASLFLTLSKHSLYADVPYYKLQNRKKYNKTKTTLIIITTVMIIIVMIIIKLIIIIATAIVIMKTSAAIKTIIKSVKKSLPKGLIEIPLKSQK